MWGETKQKTTKLSYIERKRHEKGEKKKEPMIRRCWLLSRRIISTPL